MQPQLLLLPFAVAVFLQRSVLGVPADITRPVSGLKNVLNWPVAPGFLSASSAAVRPSFRHYPRRTNALAILLLMAGVECNPGPNALRCGLLNVRYATHKAALIHDTIETHGLDVLMMTETNIAHDAPAAIRDDLAPEGFGCLHAPRVGRKKVTGGGIGLLYRMGLKADIIKPSSCPKSFESLCVKVVSGSRRLNIIIVYRPPPRAAAQFFEELSVLWDSFTDLPGDLILCGDLNCPGDVAGTLDTRLLEFLQDGALHQSVMTATRQGNLLDVVISEAGTNTVGLVSVVDVDFSDHRLVIFSANVPTVKASCESYTYRHIQRIDPIVFENRLRQSSIFTNPPDLVDDFVQEMEGDVLLILDELAPLKSKTKRIGARPTAKWMTPEAKDAKRMRHRLERIYRHTKSDLDYVAYRKACRASVKAVNSARAQYFRDSVLRARGDQQAMWRVSKQLLHSTPSPTVRDLVSAVALANSFTQFFADKLSKIRKTIAASIISLSNQVPQHSKQSLTRPHVPELISHFPPVSHAEALSLIRSHSASKSSPIDVIPSSLYRVCPKLFAELLCEATNRSFSQSKFPSSYKTAQINPLLKKPSLDPNIPGNFRPISNLTTMSKLMERLIQSRLRPAIISSPRFPRFQSAYRPLHSTETTMLKVTNDLLVSAGSGCATFLVTLDLTAAFDTVNHVKLLSRLRNEFGIAGPALDLLASYLSDRHQFVKVDSAVAETTVCSSGVPQGSVLGPLLFAVYVAPVSDLIESTGVRHHAYADDITLYLDLGADPQMSRQTLLNCADAVGRWFMENDLLLNAEKSEVMSLGTVVQLRKSCSEKEYTIANAVVAPVNSLKILGVWLDSTLSFDRQISSICSACSLQIRALTHIRPLLDVETANGLACSSISSRLDYCNSLLAGTSAHNIARLQRIQNKAARVVCRAARRDSSVVLLKRLHWLPVKQRIDYKVALLTSRAITQGQPCYIRHLLTVYTPVRELRSSNSNQLLVPLNKRHSSLADRAFEHYAPKLWNELSPELREAGLNNTIPVGTFKRRLRTEMFLTAFSDSNRH